MTASRVFAQFEQLEIDLLDGREIGFDDLDVERAVALQAVEHVETAPPALPLRRIGRVGDLLQLAQDKLRDDDGAAQKTRLGYVGNSSVDNHGRVHDLVIASRRLVAEDAAERGEVKILTLRRADHQTHVRHQERQRQREKRLRRRRDRVYILRANQHPDQIPADDSQNRTDGRTDECLERCALNSNLEKDDRDGDKSGNCCGDEFASGHWMQKIPCCDQYSRENNPDEDDVQAHGGEILTRS